MLIEAILGVVAVSLLFVKSARLVRPAQRMIVERMGAYRRICRPGWHLIVPFVERGILLPADAVPGWEAYSEAQLGEKLVRDFYRQPLRAPPGALDTKETLVSDEVWVHINAESHRLPDSATLRSWVSTGRVARDDLVWNQEAVRWIRAADVPELRPQLYPPAVIRWRYDLFIAIWPIFVLLVAAAGAQMVSATVNAGVFSAIGALSWKETQGRITRSVIATEVEQAINGATLTWYWPDIRYEYLVGLQRQESGRTDISSMTERKSLDPSQAGRLVGRYPADQLVTVYFDGAQPSSAVLDRGEGLVIAFVIGLVMVAGAALALTLWWRHRARVSALRKIPPAAAPPGSPPPPPPPGAGEAGR